MLKKCELESVAIAICTTNRYKYLHFLDSGAFKETYQIESQGSSYALKVFKPNNENQRTQRELNVMQRLHCPNIVQLAKVDTFSFEGHQYLYLIEEYLAGGSLGTWMKTHTLAKKDIVAIGQDLLNSLEATYQQRIVHRDIKPDNIMFRENGKHAVLVDFGLVRDLNEESLTKTFFMRGPGTALYSAPEQLNNNKALIDWRTDQFALGITLCQALLGVHPFDAGSAIQTVEKMAAFSHCNSDILEQLGKAELQPLLKMIEPYPINRYRTPSLLKRAWCDLGGD